MATVRNDSVPGTDTAQPVRPLQGDMAPPDVEGLRVEVQREGTRRRRAEAEAAAAEARAVAAEERAAVAEWLVALLRSELSGGEQEQEQRRWTWPWQRRSTPRGWPHR